MLALERFVGCVLAGLTFTACASRSPTPRAVPGATGAPRWSGNFVPTAQRTGQMAPAGQARAFGTVSLTVAEGSTERTRARISLDSPAPNRTVPWAILPGRCGTGSLPLMGIEQFPAIEIGSNGRGQLDTELALSLPSSGSYHVNVYWSGQQLTDVMTCANLKLGGGK